MTEYVWDKFVTERDKQEFAAGGFDAGVGQQWRPPKPHRIDGGGDHPSANTPTRTTIGA